MKSTKPAHFANGELLVNCPPHSCNAAALCEGEHVHVKAVLRSGEVVQEFKIDDLQYTGSIQAAATRGTGLDDMLVHQASVEAPANPGAMSASKTRRAGGMLVPHG
jgi:hypothetical protein